jgi:hypothetical protein
VGCCRRIAGVGSSSSPRRCFDGIGTSFDAVGPTRTAQVDRASPLALSPSSFDSQGRTQPGGIAASTASWRQWACVSPPRACGRCSGATESSRRRRGLARPGRSSSGPRRRRCWPVTSSTSTPSCCDGFTCSSSLNSTQGGCTSPVSPPVRCESGSPSRPATCPRYWPNERML